jgi:8-hydroxy-5-deazaflavin:NADPH oxidoreductase
MEELLTLAGGREGALAGKPLLDCTNAVEHAVGLLLPPAPGSAAQRAAELAPGAHVVKAFHLFPAAQWDPAVRAAAAERAPADAAPTPPAAVALCGDDDTALAAAAQLVRDVGGLPAILPGGLARARQLEEAAGFVIGLAFSGADPAAAVPHVPV